MPQVNQKQWTRRRGRPNKTTGVLKGQTTFVDTSKDDTVNQKLELITKDAIKDLDGLKKAVNEYKGLKSDIKTEMSNLVLTIQDIERPVMERVNTMRDTSDNLLKNILDYARTNSEDFAKIPNVGKVIDLDNWEIIINEKTSITIKPKASKVEAESETI